MTRWLEKSSCDNQSVIEEDVGLHGAELFTAMLDRDTKMDYIVYMSPAGVG